MVRSAVLSVFQLSPPYILMQEKAIQGSCQLLGTNTCIVYSGEFYADVLNEGISRSKIPSLCCISVPGF